MSFPSASCRHCNTPYDQTDRLPRIIISCGDTLCTACIHQFLGTQSFFECPFDKTRCFVSQRGIDTFPVNSALLKLMETTLSAETRYEVKENHELCGEHGEEMRLFCVEDMCAVCEECLDHSHKGHYVKSMKKLKTEAAEEAKRVEKLVAEKEKYNSDVKMEVDKEKAKAIEEVKKRFQQLGSVLEKRESDVLGEIERIFKYEKRRIYGGNRTHCDWKKQVGERMEKLNNIIEREDLVGVEEARIEYKMDEAMMEKHKEDFRKSLRSISDSMNSSFTKEMSVISKIGILVKEPMAEEIDEIPGLEDYKNSNKASRSKEYFQPINQIQGEQVIIKTNEKETGYNGQIGKSSTNEIQPVSQERDEPQIISELKYTPQKGYATQNEDWAKINKFLHLEKRLGGLLVQLLPENHPKKTSSHIDFEQLRSENNVILEVETTYIPEETVRALSALWRSLDNVTSFQFEYLPEFASDSRLITLLPALFPRRDKLTKIRLSLENCNISDQSLFTLFKYSLPQSKNLTALYLNLKGTKVTDKGMDVMIANTLEDLAPNLEEFEIDVSRTAVTNNGPKFSIEMPNLKHFMFSAIGTTIGNGLGPLVRNMLFCAKEMESVELCLAGTQDIDDGFLFITSKWKKIKRFKIDLSRSSITDKGLMNMTKSILNNIKALEELEMNLSDTNVRGVFLQVLEADLSGLKKLTLNMRNTETCNEFLCILAKRMPKIPALEDLELYLGYTKVENLGMCKLFQAAKGLKRFDLDLCGTKIGDNSMQDFLRNKNLMRENYQYLEVNLMETYVKPKIKGLIGSMRRNYG